LYPNFPVTQNLRRECCHATTNREGTKKEDQVQGEYLPISDYHALTLGLRLIIEGGMIGFYRLDTGEKLLNPDEAQQ